MDQLTRRVFLLATGLAGTVAAFGGEPWMEKGKSAEERARLLTSAMTLEETAGELAITSGSYCRFGWEEKAGAGVHSYFDEKKAAEMREVHKHPLWRQAGEIAKRMGGHGGMDFMMVLRIAYCLQNGLPLDQNVYDLATWCCLCELSEKSVRNRSCPMDIPDFTRGAWRTTPRLEIGAVDLAKMGA